MIARVVSVKMKPGTGDSAVDAMNKHVVPDLPELEGLQKFLVMMNEEDGTSMTIAIYDTKENMLKQEESGWLKSKLGSLVPLMAAQPDITYFEVPIDV